MSILITGGAGYIGSHTLIELYDMGYSCIVYDNLSNSSIESLNRVKKIVGRTIPFIKGDVRDKDSLREAFNQYEIDSVIHFSGLKSVSESVSKPLMYYDNNVTGTQILLEVMQEYNCKKIVFSSSATVYSDPKVVPICENSPVGQITNSYGRSKYFVEEMLKDLYVADNSFQVAILRYFNPVGAHTSGEIGEDPNGMPNNLMPYISQTAVGKRDYLKIFGNDYDTHDGTGVRDYIHVVDLAKGHVKAIEFLNNSMNNHPLTVNLGTGIGYSVLDVINVFEKVSNRKIRYKIVERRSGDVASCFSNSEFALKKLNWSAKFDLEKMCKDGWNWQVKNPNGYE